MVGYRCYFLGIESRILALRDFYADDDVEALAMARVLFLDKKSHGFELWEGNHCIHSEDCEDAIQR